MLFTVIYIPHSTHYPESLLTERNEEYPSLTERYYPPSSKCKSSISQTVRLQTALNECNIFHVHGMDGWWLVGLFVPGGTLYFNTTPIFKKQQPSIRNPSHQPGVNERGFLHHSDDDTTTSNTASRNSI